MTKSTIRTLEPPAHARPQAARIYPNRGNVLALALGCLAMCAISAWILLTQKYPADTYRYGIFAHSATTVPTLLGAVLGGAAALLLLYRLVTPTPLLALDADGLRFQLVPWKWVAVEWRDVEDIIPSKHHAWIFPYLHLSLSMKRSVVITYGFDESPKLDIPYWLLPMSPQQLIGALSQYKKVLLIGKEWDDIR